MRALVQQLEPQRPAPARQVFDASANNWASEYFQRPSSSTAVASRWNEEYSSMQQRISSTPAFEKQWAVATRPPNAVAPVQRHGFPSSEQFSAEFLANFDSGRKAEEWTNEFLSRAQQSQPGVQNDVTASSTSDYWSDLEQHWDSLAKQNEQVQDWYQDYDEFNSGSFGTNLYKSYVMSEDNPYASESATDADAHVAEGERLLAAGELHGAILRFEAAISAAPQHGRAWLGLGFGSVSRAQSENEQEPQAIAALKRALQVLPENLDALFSLSVAYTNECMYNDGMQALANWLRSNPTYSQIRERIPDWEGRRPISSFMDKEFFSRLESAFLEAASRQPNNVDPNLQNALGVLYNMSGDFDRAKDSFQSALHADPNDARAWNRLGATLANSGEPAAHAQAVQAYATALQLYPAYVRARYNLGIACLHMKAHREALEHMVTAAVLQDGGKGPYLNAGNRAAMSDSIWHTMRVAVMGVSSGQLMQSKDTLMNMIDQRDLRGLSGALQLNGVPAQAQSGFESAGAAPS